MLTFCTALLDCLLYGVFFEKLVFKDHNLAMKDSSFQFCGSVIKIVVHNK